MADRVRHIRRTSAAFLVFSLLFSWGRIVLAADRIAVIMSSQEAPFTEALAGFQDLLQKQGVQADYDIYRLGGDPAFVEQAVQKARDASPRLVLTLGSLATENAVKRIDDVPIVACLVMRPETIRRSPNVTGVWLEFPLDVQFAWLKKVLPNARNIGIIFNPRENRQRVASAVEIAEANGMNLVAFEVHGPQDMPAALDAASKEADVLLGMADSVALSPQMARPVLLFSFRNSIPFVGLSSTWVKAGAIYSLDWDFADVGAQAGEMALKLLQGAPPSAVPPAAPRKVLYSLNVKTAQQMKITFSGRLLQDARQTY